MAVLELIYKQGNLARIITALSKACMLIRQHGVFATRDNYPKNSSLTKDRV